MRQARKRTPFDRIAAWLRRPRLYAAAIVPIALPFVLTAVKLDPVADMARVHASLAAPTLRYSDLTNPSVFELPEHSMILPIEAGETLDDVLRAGGLKAGESALIIKSFAEWVDPRKLRPGALLRFHYDRNSAVDAVQLKIAGWGAIDALRERAGFRVTPRVAEQREVETTVAAEIDTSLYEAIRRRGENAQLVQQLVDVFQWDIDFFALQKGDAFSVVVVKKYAGNDAIGYGPILAARFHHKGVTYEAFRQQSPDGRAGYYTARGTPLRKQFLRAPLQFTRITSGFSRRRFHPVLHYFRPHNGVDYGAPTGTPVMTTADGVVLETSYRRGEGNYVRIRHTSRIETWYLHLSRFAKGVRRGTRVTQGDVIGYVGATGLVTAPHLDYRVRDGGTWLDPLKLKSITPDPIGGESLRRFRLEVARLSPRLSAPADQVARVHTQRPALF